MNAPFPAGPEPLEPLEDQATQEIERIPGVLAAAVWLGSGERVRDVYIAAATGASIATIRRAAGEALRNSGLAFDEAAIQIATLDATEVRTRAERASERASERARAEPSPAEAAPADIPELEPRPLWQGRFLVLDSLHVDRSGQYVTCRVDLARLGDQFTGEARELDTEAGRARAAARATLLAAEQASDAISLGLEGAAMVELFGRRYVALSVEAATTRYVSRLAGIAAVDRSVEDAACAASLSAIERWVAW
ncbi:MAG: hypothetical protein HY561_07110 [Gemmatimonadetes bacterium]|nr:hypothetical protein [Gemmatimonadota bacterium]